MTRSAAQLRHRSACACGAIWQTPGGIDLATLERAAQLTWGAAGVEVVGRDSGAIAEVVRYVRSAHERYALAEVEHARHMARWSLGDAA